ncbi:MAG: right-handed parallel beta-helix repeat-containing protein, partial [Phycisphaerales bacterium]|nr:right-handed parallel beta-helix repeat-containing protein [Phycisphaerales bacterium]
DCNFTDNTANEHGALSIFSVPTLAVRRCTFTNNVASASTSDGGALYVDNTGLTLEDCTLTRNVSPENGGGIYKVGGRTITITRSRFYGNFSNRGAAMRITGTSNIDHCEFVGNVAGVFGAAFYLSGAATTSIRHCSMVANQGGQPLIAGSLSSGSTDMRNCVASGMPASSLSDLAWTSHAIRYSNIQQLEVDDVYPGTGNINVPPAFVAAPDPGADMTWGTADDNYGNLQLVAGSGGIDKGDSPSSLDLLVDLAGHTRCVDDPESLNEGIVAWNT